jgi:hypothetical protein
MKKASHIIFCILLLTGAVFFFDACSSNRKTVPGNRSSDSLAYPRVGFESVIFFSLDSNSETSLSPETGTYANKRIAINIGHIGSSFVDSNGVPRTNYFHSYKLDTSEIRQFEMLLTPQPCTGSVVLAKACAPSYRNVFVFFDKNNVSIAQIHICFQCEMTVFIPDADYMCDFDNKVNYRALKELTDKIKQNK